MARKFVLDREIAFINAISKELIQNVVGQEIEYYSINLVQTKTHRLYQEAVKKTWSAPVKVNALVMWNNSGVTSTNFGIDAKYNTEIYFHTQELIERNLVPKEGDFIEFGQVYFEITSVTQPQIIFGQVNNKIMTKCICIQSREGLFQAGSNSGKYIDNSHPIDNAKAINK